MNFRVREISEKRYNKRASGTVSGNIRSALHNQSLWGNSYFLAFSISILQTLSVNALELFLGNMDQMLQRNTHTK